MKSDTSATRLRPEKRRAVVLAITAAALLGLCALAAGAMAASAAKAKQQASEMVMARGVRIADLDVSGLSKDEAQEKVRKWAREKMAQPITFIAPRSGRRWNLTLGESGGRFEIEPAVEEAFRVGKNENWWQHLWQGEREYDVKVDPAFRFNKALLDKRLKKIAEDVHVPARSAKAKIDSLGIVEVAAPGRKGVRLDTAATKAALLKNGPEALADGEEAKLVISEERPNVTAEDINKITAMIGEFGTSYGSSSSNRRHNVEKAAYAIHGTVLGPGEVFSYNETVGPRTARRGWRTAQQYQDGQVVDGIGGGVCQVSSTLYNAALLGGMKIVERLNHSMPVKYVPPGRDATVSYGAIDLRFRNPLDAPVVLAASAGGGRLTFRVYGPDSAKAGKDIKIVSGGVRGRRGGGIVVSTYRVITLADGKQVQERLSTDSYRPLGARAVAAPTRRRRSRPVARQATSPAQQAEPKPVEVPASTPPAAPSV